MKQKLEEFNRSHLDVRIMMSLPLLRLMGNISHVVFYRASHDGSPGLDSDTKKCISSISSAISGNNRFVKSII